MKVTRILHHSVNVEGSLVQAVGYYRDMFDLPTDERPVIPGVEGHWFGVGGAQVHLVDAPAGDNPIKPTGPHVCFGVTDIEAAERELRDGAIPYERALQGTTVQLWVADPVGNTIELQQDPAFAAQVTGA